MQAGRVAGRRTDVRTHAAPPAEKISRKPVPLEMEKLDCPMNTFNNNASAEKGPACPAWEDLPASC